MTDHSALGAEVRRGAAWSVVNTVLSRLGSFAAGIVMARLLIPEDYGVYAVALVVLNLVLSMNELGVSLAVVRWKDDPAAIAPTVATLAMCSSLVLYLVCFVGAPSFAAALNSPQATPLIRVLCLCLVIDAIAAVPAALITRGFLQKRRAAVDLIGLAGGTAVSIGLALADAGAWALVVGFVVSNVVVGVGCLVVAPRRFGFGFDREVVPTLLRFGLPLAGASLVMFGLLNADYVVIGRVVGPVELGAYLLAFNLSSWPVNLISTTVRRVSLAGFARVGDRGNAGEVFPFAASAVLALSMAMSVPLAMLAEPLVRIVYGEKWVAAAAPLAFLVVLGVGRILAELTYDLLVAVGYNRLNLVLQIVWLVTLVPALIAGALWQGIVGVAAAHVLIVAVVVVPTMLAMLRVAGVSLTELLRACWPPLLGGVAAGLCCWLAIEVLANDWLQVLVGGSIGFAACLAINHRLVRVVVDRRVRV